MILSSGSHADPQIWWASSTDGTTWMAQQQVPDATSTFHLSLAVHNKQLYRAWRSPETIWGSSLDNNGWNIPQQNKALGIALDAVFSDSTHVSMKEAMTDGI